METKRIVIRDGGCNRASMDYVLERIKEPMNIAEIGVFKGANAQRLLTMPLKKLYLIDPYIPYNINRLQEIDHIKNELDEAKNVMVGKFINHPLKDKIEIIFEDSGVASKKFADYFFDYVYIDGNHSYDAVRDDLSYWYPKVKKGGFLAGHDFTYQPVSRAVNEFAAKRGLKVLSWWTQGEKILDHLKDWLIEV